MSLLGLACARFAWRCCTSTFTCTFPNCEAQSAWKWSCTTSRTSGIMRKSWRTYAESQCIWYNMRIACCLREYEEQPLCAAPLRFCKSVFKMSHKLWFLRHRWWNPAKSRWGRDIPDISPLKVSSTQPRCHVVTYPFSGMIAAFATFQKKSYHPLWFGLCLTSRVLWWQQQKHARLKIYTHRNARSFWTLCSEICRCGKIEVTSHWRVWAQSCANLRIFFCRLACAQSFAYVDVRVSQLSSWQPTTIVHARGLREGQCCYCPGLCWICLALLHQHVHLHFSKLRSPVCMEVELHNKPHEWYHAKKLKDLCWISMYMI